MNADAYNARQLATGAIRGHHVTALTRSYQDSADGALLFDGKCGPATRALLELSHDHDTPVEIPRPGLTLGLRALGFAEAEIGNGERGSNNAGLFVDRYHRATRGRGPWCASLVAYCFIHAAAASGVELPFSVSSNAKRQYKRAGKAGEFVTAPQPGDIVCWHRGVKGSRKGHTGILKEITGNIFWSVEGNRGSFPSDVDIFKHSLGEGSLIGFARV